MKRKSPVTGAYLMGGQSDGLGMGLGRKVKHKVSFDSVDYYRMIVFFFMGFGGFNLMETCAVSGGGK